MVWDTLMFLLNGFVFILIGMQLPGILKQLPDYTMIQLIGYGLIISVVTILVRIMWIFAGAYLPRLFGKKTNGNDAFSQTDEESTWKNVLIISFAAITLGRK